MLIIAMNVGDDQRRVRAPAEFEELAQRVLGDINYQRSAARAAVGRDRDPYSCSHLVEERFDCTRHAQLPGLAKDRARTAWRAPFSHWVNGWTRTSNLRLMRPPLCH